MILNSRRVVAIAVTVLLMLMWGSTFLVTKTTTEEIPPFTLGVIRFVLAALVLLPVALASGTFARLPRPFPWRTLLLLAITGFAGFSAAFNTSMHLGSVATGAMIFAMVPAAIAVAAVLLLKERPSRRRIVGIALSIIGVVLVVSFGRPAASAPRPLLGALLMFGAVAAWSLYTVLAKRVAHLDPLAVIGGASIVGAVLLLPLAAWEWTWWSPDLTVKAIAGAVFLGVFASGIAYVVYSRVLRELDASLVGSLLNIDPLVGVATAILFLGERLLAWQLAGALVAFTGMWLVSAESPQASLSVES